MMIILLYPYMNKSMKIGLGVSGFLVFMTASLLTVAYISSQNSKLRQIQLDNQKASQAASQTSDTQAQPQAIPIVTPSPTPTTNPSPRSVFIPSPTPPIYTVPPPNITAPVYTPPVLQQYTLPKTTHCNPNFSGGYDCSTY